MFEHQTSHRKCHLWSCHQAQQLITNKKLTLQLFLVPRPRPSWRSVGMFRGHPASPTARSPELFIALFTEADAPQSWLAEAFGSREGRMFQRDGAVAGQTWAWQSDRSGRVDGCHVEACDLERETDPTWALVSSPLQRGHASPFAFCLGQLVSIPKLHGLFFGGGFFS